LLEFRILGPLEAIDGNRELTPGGAIQRALLAILLLHANRVVSADQLIDELWGEQPPSSGTTALQVRVSQLRKALGDGASLIVTRSPGYSIRIEREQLDLHRFEFLVERADHDMGSDDPASATARLGEALTLWRGAPLADFTYEPFAQAAIGRLAELQLAAQEKRIEADLALGRHTDLIAELRTLVSEHPLRERLRAQLMLALYRSGRQAEALAEYQAGRRVLVDELGIEPGIDLQDLEGAILRQEPALDLADHVPLRSILVAPSADDALDSLLALAESLAGRPRRALVLVRAVAERDAVAHTSSLLHQRRDALRARGVSARAAAFTSTARARDLVRIAREQDVDLLLLDAPPALLDDPMVRDVLTSSPCDVAMLAARTQAPAGSFILVPFGGSEHDWAAIELGAWIAAAERRPLTLVGSTGEPGSSDASRQLASASLAIQLVFGVAAEPLLVTPGAEGIVNASNGAVLVVAGLSDRWRRAGLGAVRLALATQAMAPTLLVRRGLRPGGLAPRASLTRFTWSVAPSDLGASGTAPHVEG
jgi:DNA-binding SARP family transcriptional activator